MDISKLPTEPGIYECYESEDLDHPILVAVEGTAPFLTVRVLQHSANISHLLPRLTFNRCLSTGKNFRLSSLQDPDCWGRIT